MSSKKLMILLMVAIFCSPLTAFANTSNETYKVNAKSAILIEPISGKVIFEQNSHEKLPLASVTKVMTILLIYESIEQAKIKWEDVVTVSSHAAGMGGSQIYLEPNEQQKVYDLTKSIVIASANDSSVAMAEFIAGSEEAFVSLMNQRAKDLGMNNTNFKNACGLDADGHYSSSHDIALMSKELIVKHPEVLKFSTTWQDTIIHKTSRGSQEFGLTNTNKLIKSYQGATGLKTGSTSKALYCLAGSATRDNMSLIAVILGAPDPNTRFDEVRKLLDFGFSNYAVSSGESAGAVLEKIKIYKGAKEFVNVEVKENIAVLVKKGNNQKLEKKIELLDGLNSPVAKGTKAGEIIYYFEEKEVGRTDLVTCEDVETASLVQIMGKVLKTWLAFK